MSGNKSFSRSMNGINNIEINEVQFPDGSTITSASNIVQLDTTNDFTSNNSFNSNLPTSIKQHEVGELTDFMILNKQNADKLYTGTDTNDFTTAFGRDGATGIITLTTADTGTPLSGASSFTSITDNEITAIGTNTGAISTLTTTVGNNATAIGTNATAISNLSSALDPCFKSASLNGQDLTLTPVDTTALPTVITIPGGSGTGDAVLSNGTEANPQTFTQFNKFNQVVDAPAVPTSNNHLTNKTYVDSKITKTGYDNEFGDTFSYSVTEGQPLFAFNAQGNNHGGRMDNSLKADVEIPTGHSGNVLVSFTITGEWSSVQYAKGVLLVRATLQADGTTFIYDTFIRATQNSTHSLLISNFVVSYHNNDNTTLDHSSGIIVDDTITAGNTYRYTPILINTTSQTGTFKLNRIINNGVGFWAMRASSSITASLTNV